MTGVAWGFMISIWVIIFGTIGVSMNAIVKDK